MTFMACATTGDWIFIKERSSEMKRPVQNGFPEALFFVYNILLLLLLSRQRLLNLVERAREAATGIILQREKRRLATACRPYCVVTRKKKTFFFCLPKESVTWLGLYSI